MIVGTDIHAIPVRGGAKAFLIAEERLTLIDAGLPGSRGAIERAITGLGRRPDELARIVCTHGHPDHLGGALDFAALGVEILLHPADAEAVRIGLADALRRPSRGRLFAAVTPSPGATRPLVDGDVLPVLGGLLAVHTPGHTPGSVCLYSPRERILFTGDVLEVRGGRVSYASRFFSTNATAARLSVKRIADLDVETIMFSHFPPWRNGASAVLRDLAARADERPG